MRLAILTALLFSGSSFAADPPERLQGHWVETSVQYFGQELFDPPGTSNRIAIAGTKFTESTPSGKPFLEGEIKVIAAGAEVWEIDLPHKIIVEGKFKTITVATLVRPVGKDGLQIAYFDPDLNRHGKRPDGFKSTATNGVVLISLKKTP